ncbi:hypothetical protein, partial [Salmonella enterica]|uniref:hypothetical protein n=1 Tax=Salmonella enterica TaxID=28901 RepID=UPI0039E7B368
MQAKGFVFDLRYPRKAKDITLATWRFKNRQLVELPVHGLPLAERNYSGERISNRQDAKGAKKEFFLCR